MWGWGGHMPTLSHSPRYHSPLTQAWRLPEGIMSSAYRGSCVFLWGQFEEGTATAYGHHPKGPGITGTLYLMCLFTFPVPKPPQHTREEVGRADCFLLISQVGTLRLEEVTQPGRDLGQALSSDSISKVRFP